MQAVPPFHLAIFARDLSETKKFYIELLGAQLTHESDEDWINIEWFGHQLTFHERPNMEIKNKNDFHWGFNLSMKEFKTLEALIRKTPELSFEMEPHTKGEGTSIERIKMYFKDPSGHLIEVKHFVN